jgi:hypothetical protein
LGTQPWMQAGNGCNAQPLTLTWNTYQSHISKLLGHSAALHYQGSDGESELKQAMAVWPSIHLFRTLGTTIATFAYLLSATIATLIYYLHFHL